LQPTKARRSVKKKAKKYYCRAFAAETQPVGKIA
jgi:hypothetical protein